MDGNGDLEALLAIAHATRRSTLALARQLRRMRSDHGVSAAKLALLSRLERLGRPMTASDLAQVERLQPQSITRLIADLEEKGLLRRTQDPVDRRQFLLAITPGGHDLLAEDAARQNAWLAQKMADALTPSEREIISIAARLMDKLSLPPGEPFDPGSLPVGANRPEEHPGRN
ncbi:MAG: MarR family transcriptional regulator [Rhizobiaceae bacterium]|nr:MAG: MarR family transcriptional regulator [Rhizobiaceae bacterium]